MTGPTSRSGDTRTTRPTGHDPDRPANRFTPATRIGASRPSSHPGDRWASSRRCSKPALGASSGTSTRVNSKTASSSSPPLHGDGASCARTSCPRPIPAIFDLKLNGTVVATGGDGTDDRSARRRRRRGNGERDRRSPGPSSPTTTRASSARGTGRSRCQSRGRRSTARSRTATWSSARSRTTGRARHRAGASDPPTTPTPPTPPPTPPTPPTPRAGPADSACPSHSTSPSGPGATPDAPPAARPPGREDRLADDGHGRSADHVDDDRDEPIERRGGRRERPQGRRSPLVPDATDLVEGLAGHVPPIHLQPRPSRARRVGDGRRRHRGHAGRRRREHRPRLVGGDRVELPQQRCRRPRTRGRAVPAAAGRSPTPLGACRTLVASPRSLQARRASIVRLTAYDRRGRPRAGVAVAAAGAGTAARGRTGRDGVARLAVRPPLEGIVVFVGSDRTAAGAPTRCTTRLGVLAAKATRVTG